MGILRMNAGNSDEGVMEEVNKYDSILATLGGTDGGCRCTMATN